jgi:serine/threonine protein kinase
LSDKIAIEHVLNEKQALKYFSEKNINAINKLVHTFQDTNNLYIILEPVYGLPLHKLLQMVGNFNP